MTNQKHPTKPSMKSKILNKLKSQEWCTCQDLVEFGLSYRNRISELREEGYEIESVRDGKRPTYKYKLIALPNE
jgi:hypothetical protein